MTGLIKTSSKLRRKWFIFCFFLVLLICVTYAGHVFNVASAEPLEEPKWSEYRAIYLLVGTRVYMRWQIAEESTLIGFMEGTPGKVESWCNGTVRFNGRGTDGGYLYSCYPVGK